MKRPGRCSRLAAVIFALTIFFSAYIFRFYGSSVLSWYLGEQQGEYLINGISSVSPSDVVEARAKRSIKELRSSRSRKHIRRWAFMASCSRGTGLSTYLYAHFAETLLHSSLPLIICITLQDSGFESVVKERFGKENVIILDKWPNSSMLDPILAKSNITDIYMQVGGRHEGRISSLPNVRNVVHCVFYADDIHGDAYAKISDAVPGTPGVPTVPYIVDTPHIEDDLRIKLGIPENVTVFGRYGGDDTFDIGFVRDTVKSLLGSKEFEGHFIFMNTPVFCCEGNPNIHFLAAVGTAVERVRFVNTCDAMLHARESGETFGLAVAEFSIQNKPVLTFGGSQDKAHIKILGQRAMIYNDAVDLRKLIINFDRVDTARKDWNAYSRYGPGPVMARFAQIFW